MFNNISSINFVGFQKPLYKQLQSIVIENYRKIYSADIKPEPHLFVFLNKDNKKCNDIKGACFGITYASRKRLFSEKYLNFPVEDIFSEKLGKKITRNEIVELGSFVSFNHKGAGRDLISNFSYIMLLLQVKYVLITATQKLVSIFEQSGITFIPLVKTKKNKLSEMEQKNWGSYYETNPVTGLISVQENQSNMLNDILTKGNYFNDHVYYNTVNKIIYE